MRIAYIPSENVLPRTHAFAFPIRKRMFQPDIYCIALGAKAVKIKRKRKGEKDEE